MRIGYHVACRRNVFRDNSRDERPFQGRGNMYVDMEPRPSAWADRTSLSGSTNALFQFWLGRYFGSCVGCVDEDVYLLADEEFVVGGGAIDGVDHLEDASV